MSPQNNNKMFAHQEPILQTKAGLASRLHARLESIQGTCRLSLKMGRGDEKKKNSDALY